MTMTPPKVGRSKTVIRMEAAPPKVLKKCPLKKTTGDKCLPSTSPVKSALEAHSPGQALVLDVGFPDNVSREVELVLYPEPIPYELDTGSSYYDDHGSKTGWCNGVCRSLNIYDGMTVAHRRLPFGTIVTVKSKDKRLPEGQEVLGIVADRGPYEKGRDILPRTIDLVKSVFNFFVAGTASKLNIFKKGIAIPVDIYITAYPLEELINCYCRKDNYEEFCHSSAAGDNVWLPPPLPRTCAQPDEYYKKPPIETHIKRFCTEPNGESGRSRAYRYFNEFRRRIKKLPNGEKKWKTISSSIKIIRRDGGTFNYWELIGLFWNEERKKFVMHYVERYFPKDHEIDKPVL